MGARRRGAATVEALCALLVFILLWTGVLYMGSLYLAQIDNEARSRRCAWLMSANACQGAIEGCESSLYGDRGGEQGDELRTLGREATGTSSWSRLVYEPLMNQLGALFGRRAKVATGQDVPRPRLLGGKSTRVGASYVLPCNTPGANTKGLAEDIMERLMEDN